MSDLPLRQLYYHRDYDGVVAAAMIQAAVHTTLDRLEQKGLVKSRVGDPTPQRGGKRKRHYEVATTGMKALQASYRSLRNMADGLEHVLGEPA